MAIWVDIEDMYDRSSSRIGPFPTESAAHAYCDAYNAEQLEVPKAGIPATLDRHVTSTVGVWSAPTRRATT